MKRRLSCQPEEEAVYESVSGGLLEAVSRVHNDADPVAQIEGVVELRKLLALVPEDSNFATDAVIRSGVLPKIVQLLSQQNTPKLQYECAWILTNIASGNTAQV